MRRARALDSELDVDGIRFLVEASNTLPLVDVVLSIRGGATLDPVGKEGLSRLVVRTLRMGPKGLEGHEVEEKLAALGARLSIDLGTAEVRLHATVIRRNVEPLFALLASLVLRPAFRARDIAHVVREMDADRAAALDSDRSLASRHLRVTSYLSHPYARPMLGTKQSLRAIKREDVRARHARMLSRRAMVFGFAGDITEVEARALLEAHFADVPNGVVARVALPEPKVVKGLRIRLVDKPERTQTQIVMGTLGSYLGDPLTFPLLVANTAFGGMFSGRLMNEIRTKRGYSYGAGSRVGQDEKRDLFTVSSFPTTEHSVACATLMLSLHRDFVRVGVTDRETSASKAYLAKSRCFDVDTPEKRLLGRLDALTHDVPRAFHERFEGLVREVTGDVAREAVRTRISAKDVQVVVVATAKDVAKELEAIEGVSHFEVVPFDREV